MGAKVGALAFLSRATTANCTIQLAFWPQSKKIWYGRWHRPTPSAEYRAAVEHLLRRYC